MVLSVILISLSRRMVIPIREATGRADPYRAVRGSHALREMLGHQNGGIQR